ncbi:MAG: right-handed parallel beta-helix repeat-containing protein [Planctomycetota bacterium]|jgi:hypothetical protein
MTRTGLLTLCILLAAAALAHAGAMLRVPSEDYPTLGAAVEAAADGDRILVGPGIYEEQIVIHEKTLSLIATHGPRATIMDGGGKGCVLRFSGVTGARLELEGFTITNGAGEVKALGRKTGGGLLLTKGTVRIQGNVIFGNNAFTGAGIYVSSNGVIQDNVIAFNHAMQSSGGVYLDRGEIDFINNYVVANYAGSEAGGFFIYAPNKEVRIDNNVFVENWSFMGAAIQVKLCSPSIEKNVFYSNRGCRGGAVLVQNKGASPLIKNNLFQKNWACFGGGICCKNGSTPLIYGNYVFDNTLVNHYCIQVPLPDFENDDPDMDPKTDFSGGGICCWSSDATVACNVIAGNMARFRGGGIACLWASPLIVNNTVCGNESPWPPAGLYAKEKAKPRVFNTILWDNEPGQITERLQTFNCAIQGEESDGENPHAEPAFVDPARRDYRLHSHSLLRDAGVDGVPGVPEEDMEGDVRYSGQHIDIGADEFLSHSGGPPAAPPAGTFEIRLHLSDGSASRLPSGLVCINPPEGRRPSLDHLLHNMISSVKDFGDVLPRWYETQVRDPRKKLPAGYLFDYLTRDDIDPSKEIPLPVRKSMQPGMFLPSTTMVWHSGDASGGEPIIPSDPILLGNVFLWTRMASGMIHASEPFGTFEVIILP